MFGTRDAALAGEDRAGPAGGPRRARRGPRQLPAGPRQGDRRHLRRVHRGGRDPERHPPGLPLRPRNDGQAQGRARRGLGVGARERHVPREEGAAARGAGAGKKARRRRAHDGGPVAEPPEPAGAVADDAREPPRVLRRGRRVDAERAGDRRAAPVLRAARDAREEARAPVHPPPVDGRRGAPAAARHHPPRQDGAQQARPLHGLGGRGPRARGPRRGRGRGRAHGRARHQARRRLHVLALAGHRDGLARADAPGHGLAAHREDVAPQRAHVRRAHGFVEAHDPAGVRRRPVPALAPGLRRAAAAREPLQPPLPGFVFPRPFFFRNRRPGNRRPRNPRNPRKPPPKRPGNRRPGTPART